VDRGDKIGEKATVGVNESVITDILGVVVLMLKGKVSR
jgi:hypothetical protein